MSDLTKAVGVNRPSLYGAFGDKEALFRNALDRYLKGRRFERAKSEGDLPANVNPADLARYIATVLYGIAVQAAGGASRSEL